MIKQPFAVQVNLSPTGSAQSVNVSLQEDKTFPEAQSVNLYLLDDKADPGLPLTLDGSLQATLINGTATLAGVTVQGASERDHTVRVVAVLVQGNHTVSGMSEPLIVHAAPPPPVTLKDNIVGGIGVSVQTDQGKLKVVKPLEDGPADKAGIEEEDIIVSIDGKPTQGLSMDQDLALMAGPVGSPVQVGIQHGDRTKSYTINRVPITHSPVDIEDIANQDNRVPFQVTVHVVDDNGNPLPGARITLRLDPEYSSASALFFSSKIHLMGGSGASTEALTADTGPDGSATVWVRLYTNIIPYDACLTATAQWRDRQSSAVKSNVFTVYDPDVGE